MVKSETSSKNPSCNQEHAEEVGSDLVTSRVRSEGGRKLSMLVGAGGYEPDQLVQTVRLVDGRGMSEVEAWFDTGAGPSVINPDRLIAKFPSSGPLLARARFEQDVPDLVFANGQPEPVTAGYRLRVRTDDGGTMQVTAWESKTLSLSFLIGARDLRRAGVTINMGTGRVNLPLTSNNVAFVQVDTTDDRGKRKKEKEAKRRKKRALLKKLLAERHQPVGAKRKRTEAEHQLDASTGSGEVRSETVDVECGAVRSKKKKINLFGYQEPMGLGKTADVTY
jgi:hypothetical protein